jgi:type IV pilus biogenesis protein CpaD/CtpE
MNRLLLLSAALLTMTGCAETQQWGAETPPPLDHGMVVKQMIRGQVANPNVIRNPPEGVVEGADGERTDKVVQAHRQALGNAQTIAQPIRTGASGTVN